uniref:Prokineticin domain-containing protein n=1 Tax=Scophthalmus maximus TaxID=52904 RepID=A0A8D3CX77_SCOMX
KNNCISFFLRWQQLVLLAQHPSLNSDVILYDLQLHLSVEEGLKLSDYFPTCFSHFQVPYPGKRQHHTCPCLPHLVCRRFTDSKYRCTDDFKNMDY